MMIGDKRIIGAPKALAAFLEARAAGAPPEALRRLAEAAAKESPGYAPATVIDLDAARRERECPKP
jgi:hypothetical protein